MAAAVFLQDLEVGLAARLPTRTRSRTNPRDGFRTSYPFLDTRSSRTFQELEHALDAIADFLRAWAERTAPGSLRCIAPERLRERTAPDSGFLEHTDAVCEQRLAIMPKWIDYCADRGHLASHLAAAAHNARHRPPQTLLPGR